MLKSQLCHHRNKLHGKQNIQVEQFILNRYISQYYCLMYF